MSCTVTFPPNLPPSPPSPQSFLPLPPLQIVFQQTMQGVVGSKPYPVSVGRGRGRGRGLLPDAQGQISIGRTKTESVGV